MNTHYKQHMEFQYKHEQHEDIDVFLWYTAKLFHIDYSLGLIFVQPFVYAHVHDGSYVFRIHKKKFGLSW